MLITRCTCNTFNGWKITKREGKWIDDVLTSPIVKPYMATIMLTDSTCFRVKASDHNGVFAKVQFTAACRADFADGCSSELTGCACRHGTRADGGALLSLAARNAAQCGYIIRQLGRGSA
jgi:hypothetical protein